MQIVFAIRPQFGFETTEYIAPLADGGPLKPAWYKIVWPPDALNAATIQAPSPPHDPDRTLAVSVTPDHESQARLTLVIDAWGNELDEPRVLEDRFVANQDELPDPATIELRDFASIMAECRSDSPGLP